MTFEEIIEKKINTHVHKDIDIDHIVISEDMSAVYVFTVNGNQYKYDNIMIRF
jgi:hypothetical protein